MADTCPRPTSGDDHRHVWSLSPHRYVNASFQPWSRATRFPTLIQNSPSLKDVQQLKRKKHFLIRLVRALQRPPWSNLREKLRTAALCNLGRIWVKNWGQMAVRCRHREWVAVKWQLYIVCNFYTFSTPFMQYQLLHWLLLYCASSTLHWMYILQLHWIALQCKGGCTECEPHIVQFFSIAGL